MTTNADAAAQKQKEIKAKTLKKNASEKTAKVEVDDPVVPGSNVCESEWEVGDSGDCHECGLSLSWDDCQMSEDLPGDLMLCEGCILEQQEQCDAHELGCDCSCLACAEFPDCDPPARNKGKTCQDSGFSRNTWCSECIYLTSEIGPRDDAAGETTANH